MTFVSGVFNHFNVKLRQLILLNLQKFYLAKYELNN